MVSVVGWPAAEVKLIDHTRSGRFYDHKQEGYHVYIVNFSVWKEKKI